MAVAGGCQGQHPTNKLYSPDGTAFPIQVHVAPSGNVTIIYTCFFLRKSCIMWLMASTFLPSIHKQKLQVIPGSLRVEVLRVQTDFTCKRQWLKDFTCMNF